MKCPKCDSAMAMSSPEVSSDGVYNVYVCLNSSCKHVVKKKA